MKLTRREIMGSSCLKKLASKILQGFHDGIIVFNLDTMEIVDANNAAEDMLGYTKDNMLGKSIIDFHPVKQKQLIMEICRNLKSKGLQYYSDIPFVHRDGMIFFVDIASKIIEHEGNTLGIGFLRDRKKIKSEITDWQSVYQHLAEMVGYGICLTNGYRIIYANQVFADMLGAKSSLEVIDRDVIDFVPEDERAVFKENYESLISGIKPKVTVKRRFNKIDGTKGCYFAEVTRVKIDGGWAVQAIVFDPQADYKYNFGVSRPDFSDSASQIAPLTRKEVEVLYLIASGLNPKEIAMKLNISVRTARTHKYNIMNKLHIHNITELIKFAIKKNITPD